MDESRFDGKIFIILEHAQPDGIGYVPDDKALELMEEGYLKKSPKSKWHISGHKTTKKGTELYNKWLNEIRAKHGHIWMTNGDSEWKADEEDSDYNREIDSFAYSEGHHNGYKCKKCGFEFCHHCNNEWELPVCSEKTKGLTMADDNKLDASMVALDKSIRASISADNTQ